MINLNEIYLKNTDNFISRQDDETCPINGCSFHEHVILQAYILRSISSKSVIAESFIRFTPRLHGSPYNVISGRGYFRERIM